ncbi:OmpA family protein [Flavobacterium sp. N1719]|uniref:OmpA family protein n=1 Tax=Flavobacterium sp. N1719 TaxID=2885633 RepID=UPI0022235EB3|nr:OmpA family protein [Flavobacterium sp. N1719]
MKNLYIALSFVAISGTMIAQNKDTKNADKLFARFEYVKAVQEYQKLVDAGKGDAYVYKQLADANYNMFNSGDAAKWYAKATESQQDAETYYRYAQMLKANGKYEDANKQMAKFASLEPNDQRAKAFKENPNYLPKLLSGREEYTVAPVSISSDKSDFGAVMYDNTVYYSSARNGARKNYGWTDEPFLDIYKSVRADNGTFAEPTAVTELNSKFHDGTLTISADGNTCYYSTESFQNKESVKDKAANAKKSQIYLYKATKEGETWGNSKLLPFNNIDFSTGNPSLSRDGKTLYFASNRPGSMGGTDIWKVSVNGDEYGEPVNLGPKVNTEGNENFPFIADDNSTLYFASSGKQGLGGLDVFKIDLAKGTDATNMGKPVNSEKDDFAFTFNKDKNFGFVSSNRNGNDDILAVNPICGVDVLVIVTNAKTGDILPNAKVSILDSKNNVIGSETSNEKGEVAYRVECDKAYTIQAAKDGFEGNAFPVAKSKGPKADVKAPLNPIEVIVTETEVILNPIFFEFDKSNITQQGAFELDKLVQVMKNNPNMVIFAKSHTDRRGGDKYNMNLSERRAQATVQYIISKGIDASRISGKGMGETEPKVACDKCTEAEHAQNRRSEFLIVKK